jgi:hypothetical protein
MSDAMESSSHGDTLSLLRLSALFLVTLAVLLELLRWWAR